MDVVDLIMNDHRELERLFDQLQNQPDTRAQLTPVMLTLLTAHSRAEESEVYPAAAQAGGTKDVEHSQKEHLEADQLAAKLAETPPDSPDFDTALSALIDSVKHHLEEEEQTVLPEMRDMLDAQRLGELGDAFLAVRKAHLGDMPEDLTKDKMEQQAENAGVEGTSGQTKAELKETLEEHAEH